MTLKEKSIYNEVVFFLKKHNVKGKINKFNYIKNASLLTDIIK